MASDYRCEKCGGADVYLDATAAWDSFTQRWELRSTQDQGFCEDCEGETDLIKVPLECIEIIARLED